MSEIKARTYVAVDTETGKTCLIYTCSLDEERIWAKLAERNNATIREIKDDWIELYEATEYLVV